MTMLCGEDIHCPQCDAHRAADQAAYEEDQILSGIEKTLDHHLSAAKKRGEPPTNLTIPTLTPNIQRRIILRYSKQIKLTAINETTLGF